MDVLATTGGWPLVAFLAASFVLLIVPGIVLGWMVLASYIDDDGYKTAVGDVARAQVHKDAARREIWPR